MSRYEIPEEIEKAASDLYAAMLEKDEALGRVSEAQVRYNSASEKVAQAKLDLIKVLSVGRNVSKKAVPVRGTNSTIVVSYKSDGNNNGSYNVDLCDYKGHKDV